MFAAGENTKVVPAFPHLIAAARSLVFFNTVVANDSAVNCASEHLILLGGAAPTGMLNPAEHTPCHGILDRHYTP